MLPSHLKHPLRFMLALGEQTVWTKVHSSLLFKISELLPTGGAYFGVMCPTTNLSAWGIPPTELTTPSSPLRAASPHPFHSTHTDLSYALPLYFLWFPASLNSYFGIVIKFDLKRHIFVSCQNLLPCHTFVYLFIHFKKEKLNYEWMSCWIIHVHPDALNK